MRSTMNISLPTGLKQWVERQVSTGGFSTASEYVRDLIRREQEREARARIDQELTNAIDSGESTPMTQRDWHRVREEGLKKAKSMRKKK